jgi:hypothetical protein
MRARSPVSPIRPMSPPLSASPPGSTSSHQSPHLVSPMNLNHTLDASPASLGFHYQLPYTNTLSMNSVNSLPTGQMGVGMGLGMVQGFPYPTTSLPLTQAQTPSGVGQGRAGRPRISRGLTRSTKRVSLPGGGGRGGGGVEDDDSDFDEDGDGDRQVGSSTGLGFSPTVQYVFFFLAFTISSHLSRPTQSKPLQTTQIPVKARYTPMHQSRSRDADIYREGDDRIPISNKREDIRKARIESEQVSPPNLPFLNPFLPSSPSVPRSD